MGLDVLGKFPLLLTRETFFRQHVWFPAQQCPSEKGSSLKEKNLLTRRANSFLLEKTPFQKGGGGRGQNNFEGVASSKKYSIPDIL